MLISSHGLCSSCREFTAGWTLWLLATGATKRHSHAPDTRLTADVCSAVGPAMQTAGKAGLACITAAGLWQRGYRPALRSRDPASVEAWRCRQPLPSPGLQSKFALTLAGLLRSLPKDSLNHKCTLASLVVIRGLSKFRSNGMMCDHVS